MAEQMFISRRLQKALFDAVLAGLIAIVLFAPIIGLVLDGYQVRSNLPMAFTFAGIVALGRFIVALLVQTAYGERIMARFLAGRKVQVTVARDDGALTGRIFLAVFVAIALVYPLFAYLTPETLGIFGGRYGVTIIILAL